jgi:3-phenylpropionate/cinnamic acid dioxygenase small subunit
MTETFDPAQSSHYINDAYYQTLIADFTDWQRDERIIGDATERAEAEALLAREARLLDGARFRDWLAMFVPECLLWAPTTPTGGDPRREVAVIFDDRRRMEDRIYRLETGFAWSQVPPSRTTRLVTNVEVFAARDDSRRMVRANFLMSEFRAGETRRFTGWLGYRLARKEDGLAIEVKQINMIDCDRNLRNPSILL